MEVAAEWVPGIWGNVGHQHQCQGGKGQFGIPQGFPPQGPGGAGEQLHQDVEANSGWRARSRANGGGESR